MKYKTAFRLALRVIGVFLIAQSAPWVVVTGVSLGLRLVLGFFWSSGYVIPFEYFLIHAVEMLAGLYLFFGGTWIVNRAIPSNRPYCHECAYELTGLPAEGICPECGTAYRLAGAREPAADVVR